MCKVVDGDTFHFCNGFKVRLDSIDAPEHGEPFYWESRRALANMLQTKDVTVTDCHTDRTGKRQACKVYADGKDVQAELVRMGMAEVFRWAVRPRGAGCQNGQAGLMGKWAG
jgi:endonuclease YncB( thermonuclease family)